MEVKGEDMVDRFISSFSLTLDDGVLDGDDNTYFYQNTRDLYVDPDFQPRGDGLSWECPLPETHYVVTVRTNDNGYNPHFHVFDSNTNGSKFSSCIRIDVPEYFVHGHYQDTLNTGDRDALAVFLQQISPRDGQHRTNWERIVDEWNRNPNRPRVRCVKMPDYHQLSL